MSLLFVHIVSQSCRWCFRTLLSVLLYFQYIWPGSICLFSQQISFIFLAADFVYFPHSWCFFSGVHSLFSRSARTRIYLNYIHVYTCRSIVFVLNRQLSLFLLTCTSSMRCFAFCLGAICGCLVRWRIRDSHLVRWVSLPVPTINRKTGIHATTGLHCG